jgi:uncharacterized protein YlxW (UPF0749 family)
VPTPSAGSLIWRALVPVTVTAAALLLVSSAVTAHGTDLRPSQSVQVSDRIRQEERTVDGLTAQIAALRARISAATALAATGDARVRSAQAVADALAGAAGLTPVSGPGVTVSLDDAPRSAQQADLAAGAQPDDLVIHQQDVQGVVNALWAAGASGETIMGQRVVATTAVRCVGNTLLLHGQVFSPPFVIRAVGDPTRLLSGLDADPSVQIFRQYVAAYGLRYSARASTRVTLAAYDGPLELTHAKAVQ